MISFKEAFSKTGADKRIHGYHDLYEEYINKNEVESVLEIGVLNGNSLRSWRHIWPNAVIEGMDIRYYKDPLEDFKIYIQSSHNEEHVDNVGEYDFIIDDSSHHWSHQFMTFKNYYSKAKKYYMIEDVVGKFALDKLLGVFSDYDQSLLKNSIQFRTTGPKREFRHSEHVAVDNYYGMLFLK